MDILLLIGITLLVYLLWPVRHPMTEVERRRFDLERQLGRLATDHNYRLCYLDYRDSKYAVEKKYFKKYPRKTTQLINVQTKKSITLI